MICEKPLFFTVKECQEIEKLARKKGLIVGVTYGFTGHPLVHQMAAMVKKGTLGDIRVVDLQYTHGFNSGDDEGASEAVKWRTNPKTSGPTFVLGDIGTHIYYLSEIVLPHMKIEKLLCDRQSFIKSRAPLEDNAYVLTHYDNGAVGRLWVSSVNAGNMGSQRYRFIGSKASVEWSDAHPDQLIYEIRGNRTRSCTTACPISKGKGSRTIAWAHFTPRVSVTAWANIYLWIAQAIDAKRRGDVAFLKTHHYPASRPGPKASAGSRTASARRTAARSGSITSNRLQQGSGYETLHLYRRHGQSVTDMLDECVALGVEGVEMTGGGWSKGPHFRADQLLADKGLLKTKVKEIETRGLKIAALNCSANPLDPGPMGERHRKEMEQTIRLAGEIGVKRIVTMSGLPPAAPGDTVPNSARSTEELAETRCRA